MQSIRRAEVGESKVNVRVEKAREVLWKPTACSFISIYARMMAVAGMGS